MIPDGIVKEGGENFSAGERQLFCLARGILHDTSCLVMDEATSSLDVTTEKTLLNAASVAFEKKTVIIVAVSGKFTALYWPTCLLRRMHQY